MMYNSGISHVYLSLHLSFCKYLRFSLTIATNIQNILCISFFYFQLPLLFERGCLTETASISQYYGWLPPWTLRLSFPTADYRSPWTLKTGTSQLWLPFQRTCKLFQWELIDCLFNWKRHIFFSLLAGCFRDRKWWWWLLGYHRCWGWCRDGWDLEFNRWKLCQVWNQPLKLFDPLLRWSSSSQECFGW